MKSGESEKKFLLSIIIPTYNEGKTLPQLLDRVERAPLPPNIGREIIVVDDGSMDQTVEITKWLGSEYVLVKHSHNLGKGTAVINGLKAGRGDFTIIQYPDLEYDPNEYSKLLQPILLNKADVVYGSRFLNGRRPKGMRLVSKLANWLLTAWSNLLTGLKLADMETCYKVFNRRVVDMIKSQLVSSGFSIEPEITALVKKFRVVEVPISYQGRSKLEGKKVNWKDGVQGLYDIARFNLPERVRVGLTFLVAGGIGAGTNILLLYILTSIFGWWYLLSATISFIIAATLSFYLQKFWTFDNNSRDKIRGQLAIFFFVSFMNLLANDAIIYLLVEYASIWYVFAQVCASALVAIWSFFIYKRLFKNS